MLINVKKQKMKPKKAHANEYATMNNRSLRILKPVSKIIVHCFNCGDSRNLGIISLLFLLIF